MRRTIESITSPNELSDFWIKTISLIFMLLAFAISLLNYDMEITEYFIRRRTVPIPILRPNVMSMTYAVFMTIPIFLRNIGYLKITKYTLFIGALDIMVTASIFSLLFGNDSWKIPLIDISPQQIIMIATAVAWFGMKSLSGPIWIAAFILAILRLPQVSNALGFYGVLFIIFALGGIICQLRLMSKHANCFSIESIKSDFLGYQPAIPLNEPVYLPQSTNYQYVTLPEKNEKERKRL